MPGVRIIEHGERAETVSEHRTLALISPVTEDRYGTKFEVDGWETDHMMKTGQVDLNHAWSMQNIGELPIGKPVEVSKTPAGLTALTEWAVDAPGFVGEWARIVEYLVGERLLSGWSHVFDPWAWTEKDGTKVERALGTWWYDQPGRTYTRQDLLGYGPVFYCANGDAQTLRSGAEVERARKVRDVISAHGRRGLIVPPSFSASMDSYIAIAESVGERLTADPPAANEPEDMAVQRYWADASLALAAGVSLSRLHERIRGGASRPQGG